MRQIQAPTYPATAAATSVITFNDDVGLFCGAQDEDLEALRLGAGGAENLEGTGVRDLVRLPVNHVSAVLAHTPEVLLGIGTVRNVAGFVDLLNVVGGEMAETGRKQSTVVAILISVKGTLKAKLGFGA